MTIALTENVLGIWFVNLTEDSDWMCALTDADDKWLIEYRFRYYCDDSGDAFDTDDEKNWYTATLDKADTSRETVLRKQTLVYKALRDMAGTTDGNYELLRSDKTYEDFMEEFMELPFVHAKSVSREEAGMTEH